MTAISILFYTRWKGSEISFLFRSSHRLFDSLTGYPASRLSGRISGKWNRVSGRIPDIKKGRISGTTLYDMLDFKSHIKKIWKGNIW